MNNIFLFAMKLDKFRKDLNIPNDEEKKKILADLYGSTPTDEAGWNNRFNQVSKLLERAKYEANATGEHDYENQLLSYFEQARKAIAGLKGGSGADGDKIVDDPANVPSLEPIKSPEEI